ncbi:hypothetical protein ACFLVP_02590 [Chloroflexota bacterium]
MFYTLYHNQPEDDTILPTENYDNLTILELNPVRQLLCLHMLQRGVASMGGRGFILSSVHTEEEIDKTVQVLAGSIEAMMADGTFINDF